MKARAGAGWRVVKNQSIRFQEEKKTQAARFVEGQDRKRDYIDAGLCTPGLERLRRWTR